MNASKVIVARDASSRAPAPDGGSAPHAPLAVGNAALYRPAVRFAAALLMVVSGAGVPLLIGIVVFGNDVILTPPVLIRMFLVLVASPAIAAWVLGRIARARVEVGATDVTLHRRDARIEIPCTAIAHLEPWRVPLPGVGWTLRLRSGRRFRHGVQPDDPAAFVSALADRACVDAARVAADHPSIVYARAKQRDRSSRWWHAVAKFGLFALGPTLVLFNAHQHIAYGGFWGEYYLLGARSWLATLTVYWTVVAIYLVLYAAASRMLAEAVALATAWIAPARAARVRRAAEIACGVLYWVGVPVLLGIRFLP